jgi:hypothetical protein
MPDRLEALRQAAQARHDRTLRRAQTALCTLARRGEPITVRGVATAAGVSRSWLYQQPQLLADIDRLRQPRRDRRRPNVPAQQRATIDSLRQQIRTYREEITQLRAEIASLNEQLAHRLGAARTAAITARSPDVNDMSTTPKPRRSR